MSDRRARIRDPLPAHAVADVEQEAEPDGHTVAAEVGDRLALAVLVDLELVLREPGDQPAVPHP